MACDRQRQSFIDAGADGRNARLAAIDLAVCELDSANDDLMEREVIGRGYVLDRNNSTINDLRREKRVTEASTAVLPGIPATELQEMTRSVGALELIIGRSQAAQEFATSCQGVTAATVAIIRP